MAHLGSVITSLHLMSTTFNHNTIIKYSFFLYSQEHMIVKCAANTFVYSNIGLIFGGNHYAVYTKVIHVK